jgi:2-keto-4-pentenoate hydratase/2-oxohepta-3-ene-1,7-dioic acid hydratase in catechol pathway
MKLANIEWNGLPRVAVVLGAEAVDLSAQLGERLDDVTKLLALESEFQPTVERCLKAALPRIPTSSLRFRAPVLQPGKILGVGMNYHSFVAAARRRGMIVPKDRIWFYRPSTCLAGAHDDIWLPRNASDLDYEIELAVVVGRRCRYVGAADARTVIAGYAIANDLTLREQVSRSLVFGKSFDTHTPLGPWLVTPDELDNPHDLAVRAWVNGVLRQDSTTADMIADCYELIAQISSVCTLNPGDIILTGTPDGSGLFQEPPFALRAGDFVRMEIEGIGTIENRVIAEPPLDVHSHGR